MSGPRQIEINTSKSQPSQSSIQPNSSSYTPNPSSFQSNPSTFRPRLSSFHSPVIETFIDINDLLKPSRVRFDSGISEHSTMFSANSSTSSSRDDFALFEVDKNGLRLVENSEKQPNKATKFSNLSSSFNPGRSFFHNSTESSPRGFFSTRSSNFQLSQSVPVGSNISLATMSTMFAPSTDDLNVEKSTYWPKRTTLEPDSSKERFKKRSNEDFVSCRMTKDGFVVLPPK